MSKALEVLALRKQLVQARSSLYRHRIQYEISTMRDALSWTRAGVMAVKALPVSISVVGLALAGVPHSRMGRMLALAARVLLLAKLAIVAVRQRNEPSLSSRSV